MRDTVTKLGLLVFGLILLAFVIRGFGQLIVGPRTAMLVAGPVAVVAALVLVFVVVVWLGSLVGLITMEEGD